MFKRDSIMKILLSNDDGYKADGIKILEKSLANYGDIIVGAPKNNNSACSSSLSVHSKVEVKKINNTHYIINGTSADCVNIVSRGIMKKLPDIVISGINYGSNMGDDVIYSGTVAAAIEGRFCKYSPIAISISSKNPKYTKDIDKKIELILDFMLKRPNKSRNIFNINIPDIPYSKIKGIKFTILGSRAISKRAKITTIKNKVYATIGAVGKDIISSKITDFNAIKSNFISITPLTINMCDNKLLNKLRKRNV